MLRTATLATALAAGLLFVPAAAFAATTPPRGGEFCSTAGAVSGGLTCVQNDGLRWEPTPAPTGPTTVACIDATLKLGPLAETAKNAATALATPQSNLTDAQQKVASDMTKLAADIAAFTANPTGAVTAAMVSDDTTKLTTDAGAEVAAATTASPLTTALTNAENALSAALQFKNAACTAPVVVTTTPAPTTTPVPTSSANPTTTVPTTVVLPTLPPLPAGVTGNSQVTAIPSGAGPATGDGSAPAE